MRKFLFLLFFQAFVCGLFAQNVDFVQANFPNKTKSENPTKNVIKIL